MGIRAHAGDKVNPFLQTNHSRTMSTHNEKASWLAGLLSGWGIKESWAKIIAGAIIGAAAAAGLLSSCTASFTQAADGALRYDGAIVLPVHEEGDK